MPLRRPVALDKALEEASWLKLLIEAEVFDQVMQQVFPFRVVWRVQVLRLSLELTHYIMTCVL